MHAMDSNCLAQPPAVEEQPQNNYEPDDITMPDSDQENISMTDVDSCILDGILSVDKIPSDAKLRIRGPSGKSYGYGVY